MEEYQIHSSGRKRARDDTGDVLELELAEVKRLRDDLLGVLDDPDTGPVSQDLDSVMRSFQDEISAAAPSTSPPAFIDLTSDSGDSPSQLGYLLEASDDDLGLPPSAGASGEELVCAPSESSGVVEFWGLESFDHRIQSYESFEFNGDGEVPGDSEYAVFDDGLFEFSDGCFDPSEVSDYSWRSETLPAL